MEAPTAPCKQGAKHTKPAYFSSPSPNRPVAAGRPSLESWPMREMA